MIFLPVVSKIDRLSILFSLFRVKVCIYGRIISALCYSLAAQDSKAGSISAPKWSKWALMSSAHICLYFQYTQIEASLSALLLFMRFEFTKITQVWVFFLNCLVEKNWLKLRRSVYQRNELKWTQNYLLLFVIFKSV